MAVDCQLWAGPFTVDGYGVVELRPGLRVYAHRKAWIDAGLPCPDDMQLHHRCRIKHCVNVDHLELVTPLQHRRLHELEASFA